MLSLKKFVCLFFSQTRVLKKIIINQYNKEGIYGSLSFHFVCLGPRAAEPKLGSETTAQTIQFKLGSCRIKKPGPILGPTSKVGPIHVHFSIFQASWRSKGFISKNKKTKGVCSEKIPLHIFVNLSFLHDHGYVLQKTCKRYSIFTLQCIRKSIKDPFL